MSQATGASPEAQHASVTAKQVAAIGAIAGVLAAGINVPATIYSTNRASETATTNVNAQLSGETERSRAEFLRSKRQVLYIQVAIDAEELYQEANDGYEFVRLEDDQAKIRSWIEKEEKPLDKAYQKLRRDQFSIEIIAHTAVAQEFVMLISALGVRRSIAVAAAKQKIKPPYAIPARLTRLLNENSNQVFRAQENFNAAARKDMEG